MPLETIGIYAGAGSTGAIARGARQSDSASSSAANLEGFAASSARVGNSGGEEVLIATASPNVAVYLSPFIRLDLQTRLAIVQFRDSQTGEVQQQYPSPRVVREYQQNLPESSDLLPAQPVNDGGGGPKPEVRIIGSAEDKAAAIGGASSAASGTGGSGTEQPQTAPAPLAQAASAALTALSNALTGGRQLAVA